MLKNTNKYKWKFKFQTDIEYMSIFENGLFSLVLVKLQNIKKIETMSELKKKTHFLELKNIWTEKKIIMNIDCLIFDTFEITKFICTHFFSKMHCKI